jgi:glucose-1-phosphate thymidylyltransferase
MQIICFEDDRVEQLRPIIHARPAYAISCASFRLIDWLRAVGGTVSGQVRTYLEELQRLDFSLESATGFKDADGVLLVNARLAPTVAIESAIKQMAGESRSLKVVDQQDDSLLMARITAEQIGSIRPESFDQVLELAGNLPPAEDVNLDVFRWPHDVVAIHMSAMNDAMEWRISHEDHRQIADGVFVMSDESIGDHISIDVSEGPVLLDEGVKIGPFTYLSGPIHAGAGTRVAEHAAIKDGVALGHTVKLGGEVEASIIEPFSNKQHHGFLGHSYLGSWINLGAGSCNSDLKNTYGKINVQYGNQKIATGMQFLGCFIGDYSKTAINTSIFTGKTIGVCSMLYGFVTSDVPSFVNFGRTFGQTTLLPMDVMITTQQRMFARRNVAQRDCDKQLIRDMFERSMAERDTADFEIY